MSKNKKYYEIIINCIEPFVSQGKRTYKIIFRFYNDHDEIIINDICFMRDTVGEFKSVVTPLDLIKITKYPK
jgi:hypothetical protein